MSTHGFVTGTQILLSGGLYQGWGLCWEARGAPFWLNWSSHHCLQAHPFFLWGLFPWISIDDWSCWLFWAPNRNLLSCCLGEMAALFAASIGSMPWVIYEHCIPGRLVANVLKSCLTFKLALALVSMKSWSGMLVYLARSSPSSAATCLFSSSSILLPTSAMRISSPLWCLASSIHLWT